LYHCKMEISELYKYFLRYKNVSTDSRNLPPECIFFALKGEHFNGNNFAAEALEKGAALAVVDEELPVTDSRIIKTADVLQTLQLLAAYHRKQLGITVVAITGSNGKTTTKELTRAVLSRKYGVFATQGNLNNHIGVPLTLLSMNKSTTIGIVEMGANHPGEIATLSEIAAPDAGLITNIGKAHLEGFGSLEGVAKAKGELFRYLMHHNKTVFLNEGNDLLRDMVSSDYKQVRYYNGARGITSVKISASPFLTMEVKLENRNILLNTNLIGTYNAENVMAACCAGLYYHVDINDIREAVESYQPVNNRSQLIQTKNNTVIMDAYNANPSSMAAAVKEFTDFAVKKKLFILGEMRELGISSETEHELLAESLRKKGITDVILTGMLFEKAALNAGFRFAQNTDNLIEMMKMMKLKGYHIFIKGSRSNRLEKLLPVL